MRAVTTTDLIYLSAEALSGFLAITLNSLVLVAMSLSKYFQSVNRCYIGSQAVADLLVGVIVPPCVVVVGLGLPRDFHSCLQVNTAVVVLTNISVLNLLALALDTLLYIRNDECYQQMTIPRAMLSIAGTWAVAILAGQVSDFGWNKGSDNYNGTCSFDAVMSDSFMVYVNVFVVVAPTFLVMIVVYSYACRVNNRKHRRAFLRWKKSHKRERRSLRTNWIYVASITSFSVSWLPISVLNSLQLFAPDLYSLLPRYVWYLATALSHANSFLNPIVYAFTDRGFQNFYFRTGQRKTGSRKVCVFGL
nr:hypothetical protein BaRGS_018220 [Batillaria attramentaria]